ncbi:MAG: DNA recombination protein RmuC [Gammaproteobacteria bacterium]|nr:MAG: DNA recombination protein RmuC [Gammaproteobacteria bacterium]
METVSLSVWLVSVVLALGAGTLASAFIYGRKVGEGRTEAERLTAELNNARAAHEQAVSQLEQVRRQASEAEARVHALELERSRLTVQAENLQQRAGQLEEALTQAKAAHQALEQARDAARDAQHQAEKLRDTRQAELEALRNAREEDLDRLTRLNERLERLQHERDELRERLTQLETEHEERQASYARELERFDEQKKVLEEQFRNLSNKILEDRARALQESNQTSLNAVLQPFKSAMESFKKEVQEIHHRETLAQGELKKELETLKSLNQQITQEAHELSTALKGQKKLQGNWGELVLENVLERSGLQAGRDYEREVSITNEEGERKRPDVVVYLPQGKHLIIDAKVSLNAYTRYVNAEDDAERALALKEHVQAVKDRIAELAGRDYTKLPGIKSPEVVFMFIPIESAFVEALKADETIYQQALNQNVLVATPTTLLTSLNIVRQLWRYENQNKHMQKLAESAEGVHEKLKTFLKSFEGLKKALVRAMSAYETAEGQLVNGRGNLVKRVHDFKELVPAIKSELPRDYVEKAELELELIEDGAPAGEAQSDEASAGDDGRAE